MKEGCLYTELDWISGGFFRSGAGLEGVMGELKKACLIYKKVYVKNAGVLKGVMTDKDIGELKVLVKKQKIILLEGDELYQGWQLGSFKPKLSFTDTGSIKSKK